MLILWLHKYQTSAWWCPVWWSITGINMYHNSYKHKWQKGQQGHIGMAGVAIWLPIISVILVKQKKNFPWKSMPNIGLLNDRHHRAFSNCFSNNLIVSANRQQMYALSKQCISVALMTAVLGTIQTLKNYKKGEMAMQKIKWKVTTKYSQKHSPSIHRPAWTVNDKNWENE